MVKRFSLGGQIPALLGEKAIGKRATAENSVPDVQGKNTVQHVNIQSLCSSTYQPRRTFEPQLLAELAHSIKEQGILQPILVRQTQDHSAYEIIAGERRWRAAQQAGLTTVPVIIHEVDDKTAMALALIENIQRQDLAPMDEALALQNLLTVHDFSQEALSHAISKPRSTITNLLRLLQLEEAVQALLNEQKITAGHAKILLMLTGEKQIQAAHTVVHQHLSVRATEHLVKSLQQEKKRLATVNFAWSSGMEDLQYAVSVALNATVDIKHTSSGRGKIEINYSTVDELKKLLETLGTVNVTSLPDR